MSSNADSFNIRRLLLTILIMLPFCLQAQDVIAVLDLESNGTVSKATIEAICNKINAEIGYDNRFTPMDRQYLPFMLENIEFKKPKKCADAQCFFRIGKEIGSKYIIGGSVRIKKQRVFITLHFVDVDNEKILKSVSSIGSMDKTEFITVTIPDMVQNLINPDAAPAQVAEKKRSKKHPVTWITTSTLAAGAAAAIVYIFYFKKPAEEGELSIDDIPVHIIGD